MMGLAVGRRVRFSRGLVSGFVALALVVTGLTLAQSAYSDDTVNIPDPNLLTAVNAAIAVEVPGNAGRAPAAEVTTAEAAQVTTLLAQFTSGVAIGDLTGLQAFSNLTSLQLVGPGNTFTDLTPLSGLTKLTDLTLNQDPALTGADLAPLAGMTSLRTLQANDDPIASVSAISGMSWLTSLALTSDQIANVSPLSRLTNLTGLDLANNRIRDVSGLPVLPDAIGLSLNGNLIQDPSPLVGKLAGAALTLTNLNLSDNLISDASSLAPLGEEGTTLGAGSVTSPGGIDVGGGGTANLAGNRIADLSPFADWGSLPQAPDQSIFVGALSGDSVTVGLDSGNGSTPVVSPASAGSYDASTGVLTVTDPTVSSVSLSAVDSRGASVSPSWTVVFANPPAPAGDPDGPTISGTPQVGQAVSVSDLGPTLTGCATVAYRWLRDGDAFAGTPYWTFGMGDPGTRSAYFLGATDLGHQLSVEATCEDTGVSRTSAPTAVVTAAQPDEPMIQPLVGSSQIQNVGGALTVTVEPRSGVIGDPTNPSLPVYLAQLDDSGNLVDPSQIQFAVTSVTGGEHVLTPADISISGTGAQRTISFDPQQVGSATIVFTATGTTGVSSTFTLTYEASMATTPTSRVLEGSADDSTAIDVGDGYFLVGDDETSNIRLYNGAVSGREVAQFPPAIPVPVQELDLEASARKGNQVYWFGSGGNDKSGKPAGRQGVFATTLTGSGATATLTPDGTAATADWRADLITWDQAHGNWFGIAAGTAKGQLPEELNGLDLEGAEFSPDGSELYLGMRAPIAPTTPGTPQTAGGDAVIFTVTNFDQVMSGAAAHYTFGDPILLNLDGQSIREIRKNADNQYLIIAGQAGTEGPTKSGPAGNTLWAWDGQPEDQPQKLTTVLPADQEPATGGDPGDWEGIADMPNPITAGATVRLLMDQGFDDLYGGSNNNKDDTDDYTSKGRTDVFTLTGPVGTVADVSGPGSFGFQAANTISAARTVTVTNAGSDPLHVGAISTADTDGASSDDFLITTNTCTGTTVGIGDSCTVRVRFAPSRPDTASTATLVIDSDVPGGSTTAALSGTSVPGAEPALTAGSVTITGTPQVGDRLTADPVSWSSGTSFAYQWTRNGVAIHGATGSSFTLIAADAGARIAVKMTGTKTGFRSASETSAALNVVPGTMVASIPKINGTAKVAQPLAVAAGTWSAGVRLGYQWTRGGVAIRGATGSSYVPVAADAGRRLAVRVTGSKPGYLSASRISAARIVARARLVAGTPLVSGPARVGRRLHVLPGRWSPGTRFTFQWLAAGRIMPGAHARTLLLRRALAGKRITVRVTGTKPGYTTIVRTSRPTARVINPHTRTRPTRPTRKRTATDWTIKPT